MGLISSTNRFQFGAEYVDDEINLVYYNFRYYDPNFGRWISRDPIGEKGGKNVYCFVMNNSITNNDILGLMNVCCDGADLKWPLSLLRHCEISLGTCPPGRSWINYPIVTDHSSTRKMDNGKSCNCVTKADIIKCMKRHPYSAGSGTIGSNCQTSVIYTLGSCCLSSTWRPNWYAGDERGKCLRWVYVRNPPMGGLSVCVEWELPDWRYFM